MTPGSPSVGLGFHSARPEGAAASASTAPQTTRTLSARGRQGTVHFFLQRVAGGLYVEREEIPRRGWRTQQSLAFSDAERFRRWCDDDPVRFEHPLLHTQLKRESDDLWRVER